MRATPAWDRPFPSQPPACSPRPRPVDRMGVVQGLPRDPQLLGLFWGWGTRHHMECRVFVPDQGLNLCPLRGSTEPLLRCWFLTGSLVLHKALRATGQPSNFTMA